MRRQGHQLTHDGNAGNAIWLLRQLNNLVLGYNPISGRKMSLRLNTRPCNLSVVLTYVPTASAQDDKIDLFYNELEIALCRNT